MPAHARVAVLLVAAAVAIGLYLRTDASRHESLSQWDEAYHALVARNLAAHPVGDLVSRGYGHTSSPTRSAGTSSRSGRWSGPGRSGA
jgi:hypothetical protein